MGVHPCDLSPVRRDPDGNVRGTGQKKREGDSQIFNRPRRVMRLTWPTTAIPLAARRVSGTYGGKFSLKSPGKPSQAIRFRLLLIGDMTRGLTTFAVSEARRVWLPGAPRCARSGPFYLRAKRRLPWNRRSASSLRRGWRNREPYVKAGRAEWGQVKDATKDLSDVKGTGQKATR